MKEEWKRRHNEKKLRGKEPHNNVWLALSKVFIIVMLVIIFSFVSRIDAVVWDSGLNNGLTDYFKFDETTGNWAVNSVRTNNNATINTSSSWISGKINNGINVSLGYLNITNVTGNYNTLFKGITNLSISMWVYPYSLGYPNHAYISKGELGGVGKKRFYFGTYAGNKLYTILNDNNDNQAISKTGDSIPTGKWTHVVLVYGGGSNISNVTMYINGTLQTITLDYAQAMTDLSNDEMVKIGEGANYDSSTSNKMYGIVDELAFWNRSLTSTEVSTLWNSGNGMQYSSNLEFIENSQTYTSNTYSGSYENFKINITYDQSSYSSVSANLVYNGSSYSATSSGIGNNKEFSTSFNVPLVSTNTNFSFYWNISLTNVSGANYFNSTQNLQQVNIVTFQLCSETVNVSYINFSIKSAESPYPKLNASFKSTWFIGNSTITSNYTFQDTTMANSSFAFCSAPSNLNQTVSAIIEYELTGYAKNYYYITDAILSNVTSNISLYLLNDSKATATVLKILDSGQHKVPNVYLTIQEYDTGTDTYYTVAMGKSNDNGQDTVYLNWYDTLYKFILVLNGSVIKTSSPTKISETPQIFNVLDSFTYNYELFEDTIYTLTFNNVTKNFILTFTKPSGLVNSGCLKVIKRTTKNDTTICNNCESSSSATIYCNIASYGNGTFIATYYIKGSQFSIESIFEFVGDLSNPVYNLLGNVDGSIYAFLFAGIVIAMFMISPVIAVVGALLGAIGAMALGFQPVNYLEFFGIIIIGGIVIWFLRR